MNKKLNVVAFMLAVFCVNMVAMEQPIEPGRSKEQVKSEMTASFGKMQQYMAAALSCQKETQDYKARYDKGEFPQESAEFKTYRFLMVKMSAMVSMQKKEHDRYQRLKLEYESLS